MKNLILYKKGEASWIRYIRKRIKNNLNFLATIEGPTGIGKSYIGIEIAYELDPFFDVKKQVAFSFIQMMRIINQFNKKPKEGDDDTLYKKKIKIVLFDEAQTSVNKRDWASRVNKLFLYLLSTFRHQNIIVLFTSPYADFMDSASLKLVHARIEAKGWNKKTMKSHTRPKLLQWNGRMQKFYEHSLWVIKNKKVNKLVNWFIKCPPKELTEPYEELKLAFTLKLNEKITRELEALDSADEKDEDRIDTRKDLTDRQLEVMETVGKCGTMTKAAEVLGVSLQSVSESVKLARKKGYKIKEFKPKDG